MTREMIEKTYINEGRMKVLSDLAIYLENKGINPKEICEELVRASQYMRELKEKR